jgi:predicted transcriptional regulator
MANVLQVDVINAILKLYENGWRKLRIARELGIDPKTVRRHIREAEAEDSKSLVSPTGNEGSNSPVVPAGTEGCKSGRPSQCER